MTTQLLIYRDVQPVTRDKHGELSLKMGKDFRFAADVNSVPVLAAEFPSAASDLPVVFAETGDAVLPVAILSVDSQNNHMLDEQGAWRGEYVPAFLRRYPFVFAASDEGKTFTLCIDEAYEGFNREGRGERLFDTEGEQTQYLAKVLEFLQGYQGQFQRTSEFCRRLVELDLLESMEAQVRLPAGERRTITGFKAVNRQKLKELPEDVIRGMLARDELELLFIHLQSLRHLNRLSRMEQGATEARVQDKPDPVEDAARETGATPMDKPVH